MADAARKYREANREKIAARQRAWYAANRETARSSTRRWTEANKERVYAKNIAWAKANREKVRPIANRWVANHPVESYLACVTRRAHKLRRTPSWADLSKIKLLYEEAHALSAMLDTPFHVDHVIPLRGKKVSGLHVHTNLQILPGGENIGKGNKFEPG